MKNSPGGARTPLDTWLVVVATLLNVAVAMSAKYFPYEDAINHLARYTLIDRYWSGTAPPYVTFRFVPTGYIGLDLLGAGLVHILPSALALRVLAVLAIVLLPIGCYALISAISPRQRGWALIAVLLSFNWYFLSGFLSYAIGMGLTLLWLAWWWPRRQHPSSAQMAVLVVTSAGLFLMHLAAAATMLTVVWIDYIVDAVHRRRHESQSLTQAALTPRFTTAMACLLPVLLLWGWMKASVAQSPGQASTLELRSPLSKLVHLGTPFYSFSRVQMLVQLAGYGLSLAIFFIAYRKATRYNTVSLSVIALFALYAVFPAFALGAYDVDVRFLLPAFLLPFCIPVSQSLQKSRALLAIPFAACVVHSAIVWVNMRAIDAELRDLDTILLRIPPGKHVLPLISDQNRHGRLDPYRHFSQWYTVRSPTGRVGDLFSGGIATPYLAHFLLDRQLYYPGTHWGTTEFGPLDWPRVFRDYDYIVQTGTEPQAQRIIRQHAQEIAHIGDSYLYQVSAGAPPG